MSYKKKKILGANGFIGKNIKKHINNLTSKRFIAIFAERSLVDCKDKSALSLFFTKNNPNIVINCCAVVGSSEKNINSDELNILNDNILLSANILECFKESKVEKIIFFSTYRLFGDQILENYTEDNINDNCIINNNIGYLTSKKVLDAQLKLFQKYNPEIQIICLILPNIFGPNDQFSVNGRIVASLITRIEYAKQKNEDIYINSNSNNKVNLIFVRDIFSIVYECIFQNKISGNINIFNYKGIYTLDLLGEIISTSMNYKKKIFFDNTKQFNETNIMKPNITKFDKLLPQFEFSDIKESIKETINFFLYEKEKI